MKKRSSLLIEELGETKEKSPLSFLTISVVTTDSALIKPIKILGISFKWGFEIVGKTLLKKVDKLLEILRLLLYNLNIKQPSFINGIFFVYFLTKKVVFCNLFLRHIISLFDYEKGYIKKCRVLTGLSQKEIEKLK